MPVTDQLVNEAMKALSLEPVRALRDGGQKTVRLVRRAGEELVLKVVAVGSSSPDALERARREVDLLAQIDHPNVVSAKSSLCELGDPPQGVAWLEEFLDGSDLSDIQGSDPWTWEQAAALGLDAGRGLSALHDLKVVHRDLSTNNLRRISAGQYVLMDPGFARHTLRSGLTVGGQPGTLGFLTPEHLQSYSGSPTAASDVFGVGILLFLVLTTEFPIPHTGDDGDYLRRVAMGESQDLELLRPDLAPERIAVIRRMLHSQPARRYLNGHALIEALEGLS